MNAPLPHPSCRAPVALRPGLRLGDYLLLAPLGHGAQSEVWEARSLSDQRRVALKVLAPALAASAEGLRLFHREAAAHARLAHPHIAAVLAAGEACGRPYLVQELVPGGRTLADDIAAARRACLPPGQPPRDLPREHVRDAAELFAHVADALHAAHAAGVIHRDVKPGNILVLPDGHPKVADFGFALLADASDCRRPALDGTPAYMSPEQLRGQPADARSDVFALGATLYEALTLERAFGGRSCAEVRAAVLAVKPAPPRTLQPSLPEDLCAVCMHALSADPAQRYSTAGALADDLRRFLDGVPVRAASGGRLRRAAAWLRPAALRAAAVALLVTGRMG
ncbi:MAG TPA: serine/threonine-protein kinase [Planctomycetota bacterium]|nr:serine/threonine-protein kinase [Planctomycetota bacterium]